MQPYFENNNIKLYLGSCLDVLPTLDVQADLLLTDPPYSRVLDEQWDRMDNAELSRLLEAMLTAAVPRLRDNAAAYIFCWPTNLETVAGAAKNHLHILQNIVWCKRDRLEQVAPGRARHTEIASLRVPFPETERIVFAEMSGADSGYGDHDERVRNKVMAPLIAYFQAARKGAELSGSELRDRMHAMTGKRYVFERHALAESQWELPTREQYEAAQTLMPGLRREYESLRREYESLRRYHRPTPRTYTDLWVYPPIMAGCRSRIHPAQKPIDLIADMITTSCPPDGLVLDPFAGSASTGEAAIQTGRRAILIERDERIAESAARRLSNILI
ncbi:MAG: DNA methyltransferase [Victivallaceae bacterium]|nr:DNA methyltransferase [Victivallaceae bacterium]